MNTFIKIKKEFKPDTNFWSLNPHLRFVKPFADLYNEDKTKDKNASSKTMWCVFFLCEPDEDMNLYYRFDEEDLLETCKTYDTNFDRFEPITQACIQAYPEMCLTVIERMLKMTKDLFKRRTAFLKEADYDFNTMTMIDKAIAATPKMEEDFDKIVQKYNEEKNKEVQMLGGRKQTAREKKTIKADYSDDTEFRSLEKEFDTD